MATTLSHYNTRRRNFCRTMIGPVSFVVRNLKSAGTVYGRAIDIEIVFQLVFV